MRAAEQRLTVATVSAAMDGRVNLVETEDCLPRVDLRRRALSGYFRGRSISGLGLSFAACRVQARSDIALQLFPLAL